MREMTIKLKSEYREETEDWICTYDCPPGHAGLCVGDTCREAMAGALRALANAIELMGGPVSGGGGGEEEKPPEKDKASAPEILQV